MKNLRELCTVIVLTLVVVANTFAGDMHTLIMAPPPPPVEAEGQMTTYLSEAVDPVTEIALNLLQSVLPLF